MYRIFIVEDDRTIAEGLKKHIESWDFEARVCTDFTNVTAEFAAFDPPLVLLDVALPGRNGYHWCAEIRKLSSVPVIFVSSVSDNMNIVMAMNMGGDDFIAKPFDLNVLMAKVQALLRRTYDYAGQTEFIERRGAILNASDATLTYKGQRIDLSRNECRILQTLMRRLWETDCFVDENTLSVNIARLRRKLEAAGLADFIATKKGLGYMVEG